MFNGRSAEKCKTSKPDKTKTKVHFPKLVERGNGETNKKRVNLTESHAGPSSVPGLTRVSRSKQRPNVVDSAGNSKCKKSWFSSLRRRKPENFETTVHCSVQNSERSRSASPPQRSSSSTFPPLEDNTAEDYLKSTPDLPERQLSISESSSYGDFFGDSANNAEQDKRVVETSLFKHTAHETSLFEPSKSRTKGSSLSKTRHLRTLPRCSGKHTRTDSNTKRRHNSNEGNLESKTVKHEFSILKDRFLDLANICQKLKTENEQLATGCAQNKTLIECKATLEQQVEELRYRVEELQRESAEKDHTILNMTKTIQDLTCKCSSLETQLEYLQRQSTEKDKCVQHFTHLQKMQLDEEAQMRLMHNELVELRGNVRVLCRFKAEKGCVIQFTGVDGVYVPKNVSNDAKAKSFQFTRVFHPNTTQEAVYSEVCPLVRSTVDGYNVCIIAYGQTGTGKTYTMEGTNENAGIIPRGIRDVFEICNSRAMWSYTLKLSICEIYNESMVDLLGDRLRAAHVRDNGKTVTVRGLTEAQVESEAEIQLYMRRGKQRRATAHTHANIHSSRSHYIVILRVIGVRDGMTSHGTMALCDLAGFEKHSEIGEWRGEQAEEFRHIGKSLTVLSRVFDARKGHQRSIPYRESKLTHFLKPFLAGDSKCLVIVHASTKQINISDSLRSLDFGQKAMQVSMGVPQKHYTKNERNKNRSTTNAMGDNSPCRKSNR